MKTRLLLLLALLPVTVGAQDLLDGTYDVYFQQLSMAGKLEGCSLVFTGLTRDSAYLKGAQVIVNGSLAYRTLDRENTFVFAGKLGTKPLLAPKSPWSAPTHFHFATKSASTAGKGKIMAGESGYRLLLTHVDDELTRFLEEMTSSGGFVVGFNRKEGGQDVLAPIRLDVSLTKDSNGNAIQKRNDQTANDFMDCIGRLVDRIRR